MFLNFAVSSHLGLSLVASLPLLVFNWPHSDCNSLDILSIWTENAITIRAIGYLLTSTHGKGKQYLLKATGCFALLLQTTILFIDINLLDLMGTTLNAQMISNMLTYMKNSPAPTRKQSLRATKLLAMVVVQQVVLMGVIFYQNCRDRAAGYRSLLPSSTSGPSLTIRRTMKGVFALYLGSLLCGGYAPVSNALCATVKFIRMDVQHFEKFNSENIKTTKKREMTPNIVFILNESLGNYVFKDTNGAIANSTFYESMIKDPNFFDVKNGRAVSGSTNTATPAILSGQLIASAPGSDDTNAYYDIPTIMSLAKSQNYSTALYSSYDTYFNYGWQELNAIFAQFDHVVSKSTLNAETVNDLGMDDRIMTDLVLQHLEEKEPGKPFILFIIWNNMHSPFYATENFVPPPGASEEEVRISRAVGAVGLTDSMLHSVVDKLEKKGLYNNTLLVLGADHGDTHDYQSNRIIHPTSNVLSVPIFFRVPDGLLDDQQLRTLRKNCENGLVTNLDIVPTIADMLGWADPKTMLLSTRDVLNPRNATHPPASSLDVSRYPISSRSTVRGLSLISETVFSDRVVTGWQGPPFITPKDWIHAYVGNATHNLLIHPENNLVLEELSPKNRAYITRKIEWQDLGEEEQAKWMAEITYYPFIVDQLKAVGFTLSNHGILENVF